MCIRTSIPFQLLQEYMSFISVEVFAFNPKSSYPQISTVHQERDGDDELRQEGIEEGRLAWAWPARVLKRLEHSAMKRSSMLPLLLESKFFPGVVQSPHFMDIRVEGSFLFSGASCALCSVIMWVFS
jgi:hypothetical protein